MLENYFKKLLQIKNQKGMKVNYILLYLTKWMQYVNKEDQLILEQELMIMLSINYFQ